MTLCASKFQSMQSLKDFVESLHSNGICGILNDSNDFKNIAKFRTIRKRFYANSSFASSSSPAFTPCDRESL